MKAEYLNKIIEALIELIDEGVYIVDQDGVGKFYNKAMASMEKVNIEDVLGKKFHEAFPDFSLSESTMFEAQAADLQKSLRQGDYNDQQHDSHHCGWQNGCRGGSCQGYHQYSEDVGYLVGVDGGQARTAHRRG